MNNSSTNVCDSSALDEKKYIWTCLKYITMTFIAMNCVLIICSNGLTMAAFRQKSNLRTKRYWFIINLTIADLLVAISCIGDLISISTTDDCEPTIITYIMEIIKLYTIQNSLGSLLFLSVDRFVAIMWPFRYEAIFSERNTKICILFIWMFGFILAVSRYTVNDDWRSFQGFQDAFARLIGASVGYVSVLVLMMSMHMKIWCIARKQAHAIETTNAVALGHNRRDNMNSETEVMPAERNNNSRTLNAKATKMTLIILLGYALTYFPFFVVSNCILASVWPFDIVWNILFMNMANMVAYCNSWLNMFIYARMVREFREAYKDILHWPSS